MKNFYVKQALELLKKSPLKSTEQRKDLIKILFKKGDNHFTAEEIHSQVLDKNYNVSLATIYNSLKQFTSFGIIKIIKTSTEKMYFDTNIKPHHHFYFKDSGELLDISDDQINISELPDIPRNNKVDSVEVVISLSKK